MNKKKAPEPARTAPSRDMAPIVGHSAQRKFFRDLLVQNRFPSTLLLAGPGGVGKRRVALEIAHSLFCERGTWGGCGECRACALFEARNSTDLYQIDFAADDAGSVDEVRDLLYSLQLKNFSGKNRVIIFDNAHMMSVQATNILLKSLEEPRPNTYFILVSSSKARMLPTLLSRCQTTHFEALTADEMKKIISVDASLKPSSSDVPALSAADLDFAIQLADGSFDNFRSIATELPRAQEISKRINRIIDGDIPEATKLSTDIAKDKERIGEQFRLLTVLMREKMHHENSPAVLNRIATALQNCISAERYVLERNLSSAYLLSLIFTQLLPALPEQRGVEPLLIERVIV